MNTAFKKEIDGITVVLGLDKERLDPIATNKRIGPLVESSKEFQAKSTRIKKINGLGIANDSLRKQARRVISRVATAKGKGFNDLTEKDYTSGEVDSINGYNNKIGINLDEIKAITRDLDSVEKNLKTKIIEIQKEHGIYFETSNQYEIRITEKNAVKFLEKLKAISGKKKFLTIDGEIIKDNRNKSFFGLENGKWKKYTINTLGAEIDTLWKHWRDLTKDQQNEYNTQAEIDRVSDMSAEERASEKNNALNIAVREAASKRGEFEIQGHPDALERAQAFYQEERTRIEAKYSLSV